MATKAPSTAPANPLAEGLAKVTGLNPLSEGSGTASPISYDPDMAFRAPQGDTINITGDPGTGASQSETWSHEIALENLRKSQLEFEYQQQQDILAESLRQQQLALSRAESARAAESLGLSKGQYGLQQAEEARAAAMAPYQMESARLANQAAAADVVSKRAAAEQAARQQVFDRANWNKQAADTQRVLTTPGMTYTYGGMSPWVTAGAPNAGGGRMPSQQLTPQGRFYQSQSLMQHQHPAAYSAYVASRTTPAYQPYGGQGGGGQMVRRY